MSNEIQKIENTELDVFLNASSFDHAQRVATALSKSDLVPKEYKGNIPNTLIALDVAYRIKASPLMVMQHLYIVHGKPSWSSTFLIAAINNCGRFSSLRFEISGSGDTLGCIAWATDKEGNKLESPKITIEMAKKEGWFSKNGSKWQTMPELMIRYRAAAFFSRLYAPEITMGMQTVEEIIDITPEPTTATVSQIDYAFNLIRTSAYNDDQKAEIEKELEYGITTERINQIISNLKMNQLSVMEGNYSQTDIKENIPG